MPSSCSILTGSGVKDLSSSHINNNESKGRRVGHSRLEAWLLQKKSKECKFGLGVWSKGRELAAVSGDHFLGLEKRNKKEALSSKKKRGLSRRKRWPTASIKREERSHCSGLKKKRNKSKKGKGTFSVRGDGEEAKFLERRV